MRRIACILVVLVAASVALAEELNADKVLSAFKLGAPADSLIAQINNPANTVAAVSASDLANLKSAGVPENVIEALIARVPAPAVAPAQVQPDDPKLLDIVRLVKVGLSESLVMEHVRTSGQTYKLSSKDLVYLKQNEISENVIGALLATGSATPPETAATTTTVPVQAAKTPDKPAVETVFNGLVMLKPTFLKKNRSGRFEVKIDSIDWTDGSDAKSNVSIRAEGVQRFTLRCEPRQGSNFCYELRIEIFKGDTYKFQDASRETGGNEQVMKLWDSLKVHFPNAVFQEKVND